MPAPSRLNVRLAAESLEDRLALDNTLGTTINVGNNHGQLLGQTTTSGFVGSSDSNDFYRFNPSAPGSVNLRLSPRSNFGIPPGAASLELIRDANGNGAVDAGEVLAGSYTLNSNDKELNASVFDGTYFVRVRRLLGETRYDLRLTPEYAGNSLGTARNLGTIAGDAGGFSDFVGISPLDTVDFYRFSLPVAGEVGLSMYTPGIDRPIDDADLQLIRDANGNGGVDAGEVLASSTVRGGGGSHSDHITTSLPAGTYFVRVSWYSGVANYQLSLGSNFAGDTPGTARDLGTLTGQQSVKDHAGEDYYRFSLAAPGSINLQLSDLNGGDLGLDLIQDVNNNGTVDSGKVLVHMVPQGSNISLAAGTYFMHVFYIFDANDPIRGSNYTLRLTSDFAGNSLAVARDLGVLAGPQSRTDFVGGIDRDDFYRFSLSAPGSVNVLLSGQSGLGANANLQLIRDANNNGVVEAGEVIATSTSGGTSNDQINVPLEAGTYFVRVHRVSGDTNYTLRLTGDLAGNTLGAAHDIGTLRRAAFDDFVGGIDTDDFYRFDLSTPGSVSVLLSGLSADADLQLIHDANGNGEIDAGEVIASSTTAGIADEQIDVSLEPGTYFVRVFTARGDTRYSLTLLT